MQNNDTRGSLGSKFESFGAAPSEGLWGNIADSLDDRKKRKIAIWWWLGAAAITIAGVGIAITNMSSHEYIADNNATINGSENGLIVEPSESTEDVAIGNRVELLSTCRESDQAVFLQNRIHTSVGNTNEASNDDPLSDEVSFGLQNGEDRDGFASNGETESHLNDESEYAATNQQDAIVQQDELKENQGDANLASTSHTDPIYEDLADENSAEILECADRLIQLPLTKLDFNYSANALSPITPLKQPQHKWELGLMVNRNRSLQGNSNYQLVTSIDSSAYVENDLLQYINSNYDVKVVRPIGLKFYAGYKLTQRLRIISGISAEYSTYRYTNSAETIDVSTVNSTSIGVIPAKLTTIAIPIGLEFDFIKRRRFQMGTGLSLLNEFPILETYLPVYDANYVGPESNNRNFVSGYNMGLSFDLNASVYLTDKMRIQAGPTMRYYLSQKSSSSLNLPKRDFFMGASIGLIWGLGK